MKLDENTIQIPSGKRLTFTEKPVRDYIKMCDCLEEIYYLCCGEHCTGDCNQCEHNEICDYQLKDKIMSIFKKLEV